MENFDSLISKHIASYKRNKKPIEVDFKKLISHLSNPDRGTHLIHTYPAKLLMHIPYLFLNNNIFSKKKDKVLDSFCGSGTVLLESVIADRLPIGADANPLARLIAKTKVRLYDSYILLEATNYLLSTIDRRKTSYKPNVVNIDYWFLPNVQKQLSSIASAIEILEDVKLRDFFYVCFSNLIRKVSLADPRISVPVKLNPLKYPAQHILRAKSRILLNDLKNINIIDKFTDIIFQNIIRFEKLNSITQNDYELPISCDARELSIGSRKLRSNSIQLSISSPPYAGAQKYIRSSSLSLGWLGYTENDDDLKKLDSFSIGRENFISKEYGGFLKTGIKKADQQLIEIFNKYPKRAHIASKYLNEMKASLAETVRVLKPGGYLVLVVANNQICGNEFQTQEYLCAIVEDLGLTPILKLIDDIKSYGLMTKRNKTASIITREFVLVFQK